ncbi:uncharacterized protein [Typha latifolia]|uniref:uncharacterized protein n=1 Tax=Typha latifolia TaxID=4733 RepID=UPI003C2C6BA0
MKSSPLLLLIPGLIMISTALVECEGRYDSAFARTTQGVNGKEYAMHHDDLRLGVHEGSKGKNKLDFNTLTKKTVKNNVDPAATHVSATTSTETKNSNSGDVFAYPYGTSTDSHHQISVDEYRRMFRDLPSHP